MSYQGPDIWKEKEFTKDGRSWTSELASFDEVEAVLPELASHLQRVHNFKHDDGIYSYSVSVKAGYDPTVFRKPSYKRQNYLNQKQGNFNRPKQFRTTQQAATQKSLSDTDVKYEELAARTEQWMQKIEFKLDRLLQENNIDPAGIKPASSLRNDHGNEMGGVADTLNMPAEIEDDGLPEVETPKVISDIDTIVGTEQDQ